MNLFEVILLNLVLITFPIVLYLFYIAYNQNINKHGKKFIFEIVLLTSLYLAIHFGIPNMANEFLIILNIPLIVAYLKKDRISVFVLSLFIIIHCYTIGFNFVFMIFEYIIYYIIYILLKPKKEKIYTFASIFVLLKPIFMAFSLWQMNYYEDNQVLFVLLQLFIISLIVYLMIEFILILLEKCDEILNYHTTIKKLEKEKQIRTSLFQITHEIKNPIAVCKGYLDMLDLNDQKESEKYISVIKEEIDRTLLILQDFLSISKTQMNKELMDINMLVEDVMQSFKPILKEKKVAIDISLYDDEVYINGDYNRLTQVLINVIKNSIESLDKKENKMIVTTNIINNKFNIFIKDNGIGMNEETLKNISKPFFTTKRNGTGLGISLSKEILNAHGATIEYESLENEGTSVQIMIPIYNKKMS